MHKFLIENRPLFMQQRNPGGDPSNYFFTHDGNKNVSDVVSYQRARGVVAHYDYAPFGAVASATGSLSSINPFRFSSEYHDDTLGLVYYNYRHYNSYDVRWTSRDPKNEEVGMNLYLYCCNMPVMLFDSKGEAYFAVRPLSAPVLRNGIPDFDGVGTFVEEYMNQKNMQLMHEHLFFQDGKEPSNIGFSDNGMFSENSFDSYTMTSGGYNDCIMRKALNRVSVPMYSLIGGLFGGKYNCQDFAQDLRDEYSRLMQDEDVRCCCGIK